MNEIANGRTRRREVAEARIDSAGMQILAKAEGAGSALVLIHGVGANMQSWDAIAERLARGHRVLRFDLRGHGGSGKVTGAVTLDDLASDTLAVMAHFGVAQADVAGFSLGGLIAQHLCVNSADRVRRVALISAVAGRTAEEREKVVQRAEILQREGIKAITGAARERWFTESFAARYPEKIEARIRELEANDLASYLAVYRLFGTAELADRLHEISQPALIMTGEFDVGSNPRMARLMHERIPNSELHILPGLKHSVLLEAPDLIADHLERWFAN